MARLKAAAAGIPGRYGFGSYIIAKRRKKANFSKCFMQIFFFSV
jgi:hypothetical protein